MTQTVAEKKAAHAVARKRWYEKNKAHVMVKNNAWRKSHPEVMKVVGRRDNLKRYGLTIEAYDGMLAAQGGRCANPACRTDEPRGNGRFHVDHSHVTGKVRGLLCCNCNLAIGNAKDSSEILRGLADYLDSSTKGN